MEVVRVPLRYAEPHRLGEAPHLVDQLRACPDQGHSRLQEADHLLVRLGAQEHGVEQFHVRQGVARELPRVVRVVLGVGQRELPQLGRVRDVDLESHAPDVTRHPPAVDARLERHGPVAALGCEVFRESLPCRRHRRLLDDPAAPAVLRHDADF